MERQINVFIGFVGIDVARTSNIRLDMAIVLLSIELQFKENQTGSSRKF